MNINEIAKMAGVSRATVSRYLNDGYVSDEKKDRIRAVIEKTGYQPSSQAQMLRTKKTRLIGVIIPKINSDTVSRMVAGISLVLAKYEFQLLLANTNNDAEEELNYLNLFKENKVDGVILIGTIFTKKHLKLLKEYQVPVVILGQHLEGYSCVYQDDYSASREMAKRLLTTSHRVGFIGVTQKDEAAGRSRQAGYEDALKEQGKEDSACIVEADFNIEAGYRAAKELFSREADVDALLCATDNIAIGALTYLKEKRIPVPEKVQVAGFGDTPMASIVEPSLTTVHFYYKTSGIEAAQILMDLIETDTKVRRSVKMGYEIIMKSSTR